MAKTFKYETHLHTSESSACALSSAAAMVRAYRAAGYSGLFVTDHFFNGNSAVSSEWPWEKRVRRFCLGFDHALAEAGNDGFQVFFGWEYSHHGADFLTLGLGQDFLLENPDILSWNLGQYFDRIHRGGGFIVHAHPFREAPYIASIQLYPTDVDAVEVVNGSHRDREFDRKALSYARQYGLLQTSGSDAHQDTVLGGGIAFDEPIRSFQDFVRCLKQPAGHRLLEPASESIFDQ